MNKSTDILIIDDEEDIGLLISEILQEDGYTTTLARTVVEAIEFFDHNFPPKTVILDIWLAGSKMDGLGLLKVIKSRYPTLPVIMISGHGNIETAVRTIRMGAYDFIEKPFKAEKMLIIVKRAIETYRLIQMNDALQYDWKNDCQIIAESKLMYQAKTTAINAAAGNSRILISGEIGTGKEALARMIHAKSNRVTKTFTQVNAQNLTLEKLINLFDSNIGNIAEGTLYISNIAAMNHALQNKLLNILQSNSQNNKTSIRLITSCIGNPEDAVQSNQLLKGLYHRLNILSIALPPLRHRIDDIKPLIQYFLERIDASSSIEIEQDAYNALYIYQWPGNIAELRNIIEWIEIMSRVKKKTSIQVSDFPAKIINDNLNQNQSLYQRSDKVLNKDLKQAREEFEKAYIAAQLKICSYNISKTAKLIGMDRTALHRKIRDLDISIVSLQADNNDNNDNDNDEMDEMISNS